MSKVLEASCIGGVVSVQGVPVPGVILLSEGVANSDGILIVDEGKAYYLTNIGNDLDTALGKVIEALEKIGAALEKTVDSLTAIDTAQYIIAVSGGSGAPAVGTPSPPVAAGDISGITSAAAELEAVKAELEALKGNLQ